MVLKIISAILTASLNLAIGAGLFFFLLLAMNGYSESDAKYGFVVYAVSALIVTVLMSTGAAIFAGRLLGREYSKVAALILAVGGFSLIGAIFKSVCAVAGIATAEIVRVNF